MKIYQYISLSIYVIAVLILVPLYINIYRTLKDIEKEPNNEERNNRMYIGRKINKKLWALFILITITLLISLIDFIIRLI